MEGNRHLGSLILIGLILICTLQDSVAIDAPAIISVENEGNTDSLKVTWTPPDNAIAHVVAWSLPDGSDSDTSPDLISGTATEYTISGLTPGTLYNVTVTAQNGTDDTSDDSEQGRTNPAPVLNLAETGATNESISAEWNKPSGAVDQYTFACSNGTENPSSPITEDNSGSYQVSCEGLSTAGAYYNITVTSQSGVESSDESTITITALPNMVRIEAGDGATNSSFVASWNHPEGEIDSFQVFCYENDTAPEEISNLGSNITYEVTCESLPTAGTGYKFSVVSVSGSKNVTSETVLYTNPNTVVLHVEEGGITTRQITVQWDNPMGEEDSFNVDCGADGSNDFTLLPADATNNIFQATCNVSMAGAPYNINVTSVSGDKESSVTTTFTAATPEGVAFEESSSNTTSITVTWIALAGADMFTVACSEGALSPDSPLPGSATEVTCNGVTSGGNHSVTVITLENNGESPAMVMYVVALPLSANLTAGTSTIDSVSAMWPFPGRLVEVFKVDCSNGTESNVAVLVNQTNPDPSYLVSCDGVWNPGDNYTMVVTSVSNEQENSASIVLTALPLSVELVANTSTTSSVSATWLFPGGVVEEFEVQCSDGNETTYTVQDMEYQASCMGLDTPGKNYTMTVTSFSNTQRNSASIVLTALPEAVTLNEESAMVNTTTITASWNIPTGIVEYYQVSCSNGTASPDQVNPSDDLIASCTGLSTPGNNYTIFVTSVSNGKLSAASTITITTLPEAVTLNEESAMVNTTTITASWTMPNGIVDYYAVSCFDGTASPAQVNPSDDLIASCTGLSTPGDNYTISVTSISNGKGSSTSAITITALPEAVTLNEESAMVNTTTITASWTIPSGTVEYYEVSCSNNGIASPDRVDPSGDLRASCTGLSTPGDNYTISVISVSYGKRSPASTITITALPEAVTLNEESAMVNTTTITASWSMPSGTVEYYDVSCSNNGIASPDRVDPSGDLRASCTGLSTPGDNYTISVISVSYGKRSPASNITITALPAAVELSPGESNTTAISATWTVSINSVVDTFNITCSDGTASPASIPVDSSQGGQQLTAYCVGLPKSGEQYDLSVVAISNNKRSAIRTVGVHASPASVVLMEGSPNTTSVSANWAQPDGTVKSYNISCSLGDASPATIEDTSQSSYVASCVDLPVPGDSYTMTVYSIVDSGTTTTSSSILLVALPLSANLTADTSTTYSVSAMWPYPGGSVEVFEVDCSNGTESNARLLVNQTSPDPSYLVSCDDVLNPGDTYSMVVTSVSNGKDNSASIILTALPLIVNLTAGDSTTSSVTATWDFPGGIVDEFEVECSNGTASTPGNGSDQDYFASCEDVDYPGDDYTMTVTSLSNTQRNAATIVLTALPEAVALNEESNMVTTTTITASWTMPNGIVEYYEVSCSNGTAAPAQVNPSDALTASCTGLSTPGDDYNISVTAVSNGQRSETDTITITALPEAVELSPGESNITAISATWTMPNGVVDTFNITCSNGTASPASIPVISSQAEQQLTAYCVELPESGEQYDLSVVAISNDKLSAVSTVEVFALPLGVDLEEGPSTLTSVNASWMRQEDTVESYSIECEEGDAFPSTIEETNQESFSAACVNLTRPGAMYIMTVYSEVGTDSSSNSTRASSVITLVAVPASVESIAVTQYATTTVDVQWNLMQCSDCVYNYFLLTFEPDSQEPIRVDYTDGVNEYSSQVSGLTEGKSYSFTVVSVSGVGVVDATLKTSEEKSVDQRTVPATPSDLSIVPGQRELNLVWAYQGDADNFTITVTPNQGIAMFNGDFNDPAAEVTGLTPGTMYDIAIVTASGDERSEPITQTNRTLPDKPSPVRNPQAEVVDKNTITLTYESPDEPNGDITSYIISYIGTRDGNTDHEFSDVYGVVLTVTYEDLRAGFSYIFTIIAVNDGPFESDPVSTEPVETPQEEPPPVEEDYPYEDNTVVSATSTTSLTVVLPEDLFSHDNGELSTFAVIITREANDATVGSTELTYDEARAQNGNMLAYITAIDIPYPYPSQFGSNRRRRATDPTATVVIGDGTCAGSPKEYCNKGLDDDTQYYYVFRAYNGMGDVTSGTFGPVTTVKDNTAAIAAGVSVSLIIIIVAVVVVVVFLKRRQPKEPSPRPSLEGRENQAYDGPDHEMRPTRRKTGGSMHRKSHSKPIVLNKFEGHYGRMKADSDFRFTEEYDEIRLVGKDQAIVSATEMVNRAKNRFTNILPYEHSRVKLAALADDPGTDYINANYIPGYNSPREFMACQGPLPGTVDDMWRMIWEKKTSIIVMLTQLVEKGKIKCHEYWPADYNPVTYGSIQVSIQALQQYDHWVIREFSISQGDEIRKLTQYHFMSWPDHGVPEKTWTMLDFVRTVREAIQKTASDRPIVAHCSAGVGRTGTYIALDRLMQAMQENDYIDIFGIICEMRMQRNHMVQTEKQYIFIHECVMDLMRRGEEEDTGESIYVNLPSNGFKDPDDVNKNLLDQAV